MRINHNIAALNTYRQLASSNAATSKSLEKLSSGFKINRAGDDAAGLAISEKMRAQIKGLETASRNANDGISLIQTAEGALTEVHSMLNRMTELASQSANGTYADLVDREALQTESSALTAEIDRIATSTDFNGKKLLDGTISTKTGAVATAGGGATSFKLSGGNQKTIAATQTFIFTGTTINTQAGATLTNGSAVAGVTWAQSSTSGSGATSGTVTFKALINDVTASAADQATYRGMTVTVAHGAIAASAGTSETYTNFDGGGLDLQIGDTATQKIAVVIDNMSSTGLGINGVSVATQDGASAAISTIKTAINTVSSTRATLGATQNRLEHTINNLGVATENITAAESRIRDVDMAKEMMEFTKNNILTQAATAMMAQANQQPQGVLQLLR